MNTATIELNMNELENGKRLELGVKDPEYGMLAEGDQGRLSWQGTRYLGFERT